MPGRQQNRAIYGDQNEKVFASIIARLLSVVPVPRPGDFGVDAYCHVLHPLNPSSVTAHGAFGVQIRGHSYDSLSFGGLDDEGTEWKWYEIEWLRSVAVPLYLARVSADYLRVDFHALWSVWLVLGGSPNPYRIRVSSIGRRAPALFSKAQRRRKTGTTGTESHRRCASALRFSP